MREIYLIVLILLGHGLFFRLSFALVPVILEPYLHLKQQWSGSAAARKTLDELWTATKSYNGPERQINQILHNIYSIEDKNKNIRKVPFGSAKSHLSDRLHRFYKF